MAEANIVLKQIRIWKSVSGLGSVTLPAFTLLTGINGSGKSHLLEAIKAGAIEVSGVLPDDIALFDWNTLVPNDTGTVTVAKVYEQRDWILDRITQRKHEQGSALTNILAQYRLDSQFSDPWDALDATEVDIAQFELGPMEAPQLIQALANIRQQLENSINHDARNDPVKVMILSQLAAERQRLHALKSFDFDRRQFAGYNKSLFEQSFGELFLGYFEKQKTNIFGKAQQDRGKSPKIEPLSDDDFIAMHGRPPWEFVNKVLKRAKLDFVIDEPDDPQATRFSPTLTKHSSGKKVEFAALSSGERVLMSLAFALYYSTDKRQNTKKPKLILFDEIDAPLHPSMSRPLLEIVNDELVERENLRVIMVTHSPSTVAVAPEASIHLLHADPSRIVLETKRRAIATLTSEIPTMSIDFSGRRQVFVEDNYDAENYQNLFLLVEPLLETERSLAFIGAGQDNMGNGCAAVIRIVETLAKEGNTSVLGLIDKDAGNQASPRVRLVGGGSRYSIENYLFDPALVAALLLIKKPGRDDIGLSHDATFALIGTLPVNDLQRCVDMVQSRVMSVLEMDSAGKLVKAEYAGGFSLDLDSNYLNLRGHNLEAALKEAFPELRAFHKTNELSGYVIDMVIRNHGSLAPRDLIETFRDLCLVEI